MENWYRKPYNYETPDWAPLERAVLAAGLPVSVCGEFMWMCEDPQDCHQYKHRDTRGYVRLTVTTSALACARDLRTVRGAESEMERARR